MDIEVEINMRIAQEVADEARKRKKMKNNGTVFVASESEMRKDVNQNVKYRNKKLVQFQSFLDAFDEAGRPVEMESTIRSNLINVYSQRVAKPDDLAMWLVVEGELEVRGLSYLIPSDEDALRNSVPMSNKENVKESVNALC